MSGPVLPPGWTVQSFETIGSTNDVAAEHAAGGAPEGLVVWALEQQGGRGRRGRQWHSPKGNLYSSTVLRPQCHATRAGQLGLVAALAVADTIGPLLPAGPSVSLKWPNDVLVDGAKICGILAESAVGPDGAVDYVVMGIGLNVASHPPSERIGYRATCLSELGGSSDLPLLLGRMLAALHARYGMWRDGDLARLRQDWLARAAPIGSPIAVRVGEGSLEGRFAGLDTDGALLVEDEAGVARRITAGEVVSPTRQS